MNMAAKNSFKKGNIELLLLAILRKEDCYGYQITQSIKELSEERITVTEGALYPILYRLSDQGYVTEEERLVGRRMKRVYYHLNEKGESYFQELLEEYKQTQIGMQKILAATLTEGSSIGNE